MDIEKITKYIFIHNEPCDADAIFVVGGSLSTAAERAAELYSKGYSEAIFIGGKYSIKRSSFPIPEYATEYDFYKEILIQNGVRETDIFGEKESTYTKQNAEFAGKVAAEYQFNIRRAMLVCKSFHARRCLLFYQMYFPDTEFYVIPFDGFDISRDNWYKTEYGKQRVLGELKRIKEQVPGESFAFDVE